MSSFFDNVAESNIRRLLDAGPSEGEDFFRLKLTGHGETQWMNVTPERMEAIAAVFAPDPLDALDERVRELEERLEALENPGMENDQARAVDQLQHEVDDLSTRVSELESGE